MTENSSTPDISKGSCPATICYSIGCNNPATVTVKLPLNQSLRCLVHVCNSCLPKYQVVDDDSDKIHHQHHVDERSDNFVGAAKI